MTVRDRLLASALISGLVVGCASGPLGERPEVTTPQAPALASEVVTVTFDLRDGDRTTCSVRIEYSTDGGATWNDATIASSSAGVVTGKGSITGIRPSEAYSRITVLWDSWTDNVGTIPGGQSNVKLRVTPSDGEGTGAPAASAASFTVNNYLAKLEIESVDVSFTHGYKNASNPTRIGSFTIRNAGVVDLNWQVTGISYSAGGTGWVSTPIVNASGVTVPGGTAVVNVQVIPNDAIPDDLPPGVHTADITVGDTNVPPAYMSPQTVTVTLTVSRPVMNLEPTSVTFDEVAWDCAPVPGNKTFTIHNDGPSYTELYWQIDDSATAWLTVTDPAAKSGMIPGGGTQTVTLSADQLSPTVQPVGTHPCTLTVDETAGAGVPSRTVDVTLQIRPQRPEIFIHDGGGAAFPGDILLVSCVEGAASSGSFSIRNVGEPSSRLRWAVTDDAAGPDWLTCLPAANATPWLAPPSDDAVTVNVSTAGLAPVLGVPDDYTATVTVSGDDGNTSEPTVTGDKTLTVHLNVLVRGQLDLSSTDVSFTDAINTVFYPVGEWVDVDLTNSGEADLNWSGAWVVVPNWISVTGSTSGTVTPSPSDFARLTFTVNANAINLSPGDNTATFRYTNTDTGDTRDLAFSLYVMAQAQLETSPTEAQGMHFDMAIAGPVTSSQDLDISNSGEAPLDWQVSEGAAWLSLTNVTDPPCAATETDTVQVTVDRTGLGIGSYSADITVSAADATGTPKVITVYLNVVCQIGAGTTSARYPMFTYWCEERTQVIYLAGEIGGAVSIGKVSLQVAVVPSRTMSEWTIRMKHTTDSSFASAEWESGWTQVYQANETVTGTGWVTFVLTTPFDYDGTRNLMIDFSFNNLDWSGSDDSSRCYATSMGSDRCLYLYRDEYGGTSPLDWSGSTPAPTTTTFVPNIRLIP